MIDWFKEEVVDRINGIASGIGKFMGDGISLLKKVAVAAIAIPILSKVLFSGDDNKNSSNSTGQKTPGNITPQFTTPQGTGTVISEEKRKQERSQIVIPDITGKQQAYSDISKVTNTVQGLSSQSDTLVADSLTTKKILPMTVPKGACYTIEGLIQMLVQRENVTIESLQEVTRQLQISNKINNITNRMLSAQTEAQKYAAYCELKSMNLNNRKLEKVRTEENMINTRVARREYQMALSNKKVGIVNEKKLISQPSKNKGKSGGGLGDILSSPFAWLLGALGFAKLFKSLNDPDSTWPEFIKTSLNKIGGGIGIGGEDYGLGNMVADIGGSAISLAKKGLAKTGLNTFTKTITKADPYIKIVNWLSGANKVNSTGKQLIKSEAKEAKLLEKLIEAHALDGTENAFTPKQIEKLEKQLMEASEKTAKFDAKFGKAVTKFDSSIASKTVEKGLGILGKEGGEAAGKIIGKEAYKIILKEGAEVGLKTVGKRVGKLIPFAGAGIGAAFAYDRYRDGDYGGAAAELISGVLGALGPFSFGLGTMASIAIDVGLVYKDIITAARAAETTKEVEDMMADMIANNMDISAIEQVKKLQGDFEDLSSKEIIQVNSDLKRLVELEKLIITDKKNELNYQKEKSEIILNAAINGEKNLVETRGEEYSQELKDLRKLYKTKLTSAEEIYNNQLERNKKEYSYAIEVANKVTDSTIRNALIKTAEETKNNKDTTAKNDYDKNRKKINAENVINIEETNNSFMEQSAEKIYYTEKAKKELQYNQIMSNPNFTEDQKKKAIKDAKLDDNPNEEYDENKVKEAKKNISEINNKSRNISLSILSQMPGKEFIDNFFSLSDDDWVGSERREVNEKTREYYAEIGKQNELKKKKEQSPTGGGDYRRVGVGSPDGYINATQLDKSTPGRQDASIFGTNNYGDHTNSYSAFAEAGAKLLDYAWSGLSGFFGGSSGGHSWSNIPSGKIGDAIVPAVKYNADVEGARKYVAEYLKGMEGKLKYSMEGPRDPKRHSADCSSMARYGIQDVTGIYIGTKDGDNTLAQWNNQKGEIVPGAMGQIPFTGTASNPEGFTIPQNNLAVGDVLYFRRYLKKDKKTEFEFTKGRPYRIGHCGVYIGNGKYIHHPKDGGPKIDYLNWDATNYIGAKRFITADNLKNAGGAVTPSISITKGEEPEESPLPKGSGDKQYEFMYGGDRIEKFKNDPILKDIGIPLLGFGSHVTSLFGSRNAPKLNDGSLGSEDHEGLDLSTGLDSTPTVTATESGKVISIDKNRASDQLGNVIYKTDSGLELQHYHIEPNSELQIGSKVRRGDVLGQVAPTSKMNSHLHFGVKDKEGKFMDPVDYLSNLKKSKHTFTPITPLSIKPPNITTDNAGGSGDDRSIIDKSSTSASKPIIPIINNDNKSFKAGDTNVHNVTNYYITQNNPKIAEIG